MNLRQCLGVMLVVVLLAAVVAGCGGSTPQQTPAPKPAEPQKPAEPEKKLKIGFVPLTLYHEFYVDAINGAKKAAQDLGVELVVMDPEWKLEKEIDILETWKANKGVDAVCVTAIDVEALTPVVGEVVKAGIPVVSGELVVKTANANVILNDFEAGAGLGRWAGEYIKKNFNGKAEIAVLDLPIYQTCIDRAAGFIKGVRETAPDVKIVAQQNGEGQREKAMAAMESILRANPRVSVGFGINDQSGMGILAAMEASGKTAKNSLVVCMDSTKETRTLLRGDKSALKATVVKYPNQLGKIQVETAVKLLKKEQVPNIIPFPWEIQTKDNVPATD